MPPPARLAMGRLEWSLLLALSVLWGGSFFFAEIALHDLPPLTVLLGRVGIAAFVLVAGAYATGQRMPREWRPWRRFVIMGIFNNVIPFSLILWAQTQIEGSLAAILNATTPLFVVALAHVATVDEKLTAAKLAGVVLGFAGVAIMFGYDALAGFSPRDTAQLCVLGAAFSYALAGLYGRRFSAMPPLVTAAGQLCAATILILPIALAIERPWLLPVPGAAATGAVAGIAILSTAVAYILYFRILALAGASNLLLVTFLIPVTAIILGALFLGDQLSAAQVAGMLAIAAGLAAIDGRLLKFLLRNRFP